MDRDQVVRELLDRQLIGEVLARRARSADRRDLAAALACYHRGATENHEEFTGSAAEFLRTRSIIARPDREVSLLWHLLGMPLIELDGDRADVETYHVAVLEMTFDHGPRHVSIGGRYLDRFARMDGRWAIAHRDVVFDWSRVERPTSTYWDMMGFNRQTLLIRRFDRDGTRPR